MPFIVPIITTIAGTVGSFIAAIGVVGQLAVGLGLNLVSAYLDKKAQEKAKKEAAGVQFDKQYGQDVPRQVPVGLTAMAGHDCYVNTWDKSNKRLQNLYILGDWPSGGLTDRVGVNGKWYTLGAVDGDIGRKVQGEWENLIWIKDIPGSLTQPVDPYLLANANPAGRWSAEHRGIGMAMVIATLKYDQEKNNRFPDLFFESKGSLFYDWRKDSSVGGGGPHRWNDVTTWEPSRNAMVALYCYMRGLKVGDDLFCGMGILPADLPLAKWTLAANLCVETVEGEPRYEVSAILDCGPDATHATNVESLLKSCGGYMIDGVEGIWPVVGSDQPVVATLTDDDLIRPRKGRFQRWRSQGQLVNSVAGTHPNPENLWAMEGYPAQIATNLLASDRRSRDIPMDFPMVTSKRQAAQLASIYLLENRLEATASWTFRPRWMGLEAGDWIRVNSKRYGDFTYLISNSALASLDSDGPRNINVSLQERNGSIYDPTANPSILFPPVPSAPPDYLSEVQNFSATAQIVTTETGAKYLAIRTQRDPVEDETVLSVDFRYWPTNQPDTILLKSAGVDEQVVPLVEGVVSRTKYAIQTKLVTDPYRAVPWSSPIEVTTPDQPYTDISVELGQLQQDARNVLTGTLVELDRIKREKERVATDAALGTADNIVARQIYKKELATAKSLIVQETRQRVTETSALGEVTTLIQTEITDPETGLKATSDGLFQISNQVNNPTTGLEALANAVLDVEATVGDISAGGLISFQAQIPPPAGVLSQISILARATVNDAFLQTGFVIQVYLDGATVKSKILILTDRLTVWDGTNQSLPFAFEAGVLKLAIANIGIITAGIIRSIDSKFIFTISTGTMEWYD